LPNLATAENWASYRSIGALAASVIVLFVLLVIEPVILAMGKKLADKPSRFLSPILLLVPFVMLVLITVRAQSNVLNGFVLPNVTELNNLASLLSYAKGTEKSGGLDIVIIPSSWTDSAATPMAYDEFGMHSSIHDYYAKPIVEIVLGSMNITPKSLNLVAQDVNYRQQFDQGERLVVDFPKLVTSQRFKTIEANSVRN